VSVFIDSLVVRCREENKPKMPMKLSQDNLVDPTTFQNTFQNPLKTKPAKKSLKVVKKNQTRPKFPGRF
jgi:hypothetical protein